MSKVIEIGNHKVGDDYPVYFIADIAANHDGDLDRAKALIYQCAEAGADAAKFQNFRAETIVSDRAFNEMNSQVSHQAKWGKSVFEAYSDASLPMEWTEDLKKTCDDAGIDYLTAPYDLDIIAELSPHVCAWKLGSGDITWHENIEAMARDGKPLLMATGAAEMSEVRMAMDVARSHTGEIVLMQCNTNYTASLENFRHISLNVLKAYQREFPDVVLGLSDHTPGHVTVLGAVSLGARVIEKHFTDNTSRTGPDHKFSMDPTSWREMIDATRLLEAALGTEKKQVMENEKETVKIQRRGIRAVRKICKGEVLSTEDLISLRPCSDGCLPPYRAAELLGKKVKRDLSEGDCVSFEDLE